MPAALGFAQSLVAMAAVIESELAVKHFAQGRKEEAVEAVRQTQLTLQRAQQLAGEAAEAARETVKR